MSAERIPQYRQEAEVIYLFPKGTKEQASSNSLVAFSPSLAGRPSGIEPLVETTLGPIARVYEYCYNQIWLFKRTAKWHSMSANMQCLVGAVIFTFNALVVLYALYYLKSMMGIDLFPHQHLEDFFPIPGYQRW